jgi:uncharacterized protein
LASIALPRLRAPKLNLGALKNPRLGLAAAGVAFLGVVTAMTLILSPLVGGQGGPNAAFEAAMRDAPAGWRKALRPATAHPHLYPDVVRLSERPLSGHAPSSRSAATPAIAPILAGDGLAAAPIAGLYASGPGGPLPIIGADGRTPAQAYARPFQANGRPKIALVIGGLGLNARTTRQAIETLRPEVTLSFVVYAQDLQGWIDLARARGHEVLLEAPMEPVDYPDNDPGPYTLMADSPPLETTKRLEWVMSRASGYFGLANYLGGRFLGSNAAYGAFISSVRARGLAFVDDGAAARHGGGVPRASAERVIDSQLTGPAIEQQLMALETGALQRGQALGSGFAYPVTLERVARWTAEVEQRGYQLAPASALLARR